MSLAATLAELEALMLREASRKERARSRIICGTERNTAREQQRAKGNIIGQDTHTVLPHSHQLRPGRVSGEGGAEHEGVEQSGGVTTLPSTTHSSSVWKMGKGRGLLKLDRPSNCVLCLGHRRGVFLSMYPGQKRVYQPVYIGPESSTEKPTQRASELRPPLASPALGQLFKTLHSHWFYKKGCLDAGSGGRMWWTRIDEDPRKKKTPNTKTFLRRALDSNSSSW